jgi:hypothetical protein
MESWRRGRRFVAVSSIRSNGSMCQRGVKGTGRDDPQLMLHSDGDTGDMVPIAVIYHHCAVPVL